MRLRGIPAIMRAPPGNPYSCPRRVPWPKPLPSIRAQTAAAIDPLDLFDVRAASPMRSAWSRTAVARFVDAEVPPLIRGALSSTAFRGS